jgi:putative endonuclease
MKYHAYIISNHSNSVLYTGITNNLKRRVFEHKTGKIKSSFAKKYKLYKLLWFQEFNSSLDAIEAEKKSKAGEESKRLI